EHAQRSDAVEPLPEPEQPFAQGCLTGAVESLDDDERIALVHSTCPAPVPPAYLVKRPRQRAFVETRSTSRSSASSSRRRGSSGSTRMPASMTRQYAARRAGSSSEARSAASSTRAAMP